MVYGIVLIARYCAGVYGIVLVALYCAGVYGIVLVALYCAGTEELILNTQRKKITVVLYSCSALVRSH